MLFINRFMLFVLCPENMNIDILDPDLPIRLKKKVDVKKNKGLIRLFVNGLPRNMTEDELSQLFMKYNVFKAKIESRGYGIVFFYTQRDAKKAYDGLNGSEIGRKPIRMDWAREES